MSKLLMRLELEKLKKMQKAATDIEKILNKVNQVTEGFLFDKQYPQHFLLITLHGSIIEMLFTCNTMLRIGVTTCIPIIARSMIEALSSMAFIAIDKNNINSMTYDFQTQRKEQALSLLGLDLKQYDKENVNRIIEQCDEVISTIKQISTPMPKAKRRIKDFLDIHFLVAYKMYCSFAHNDLMALEHRHVVKYPNDTYSLEVFKETDLSECIHLIDVILSCLMVSTLIVSSKVTSIRKDKIKNALHKFRQFKSRYYGDKLNDASVRIDRAY